MDREDCRQEGERRSATSVETKDMGLAKEVEKGYGLREREELGPGAHELGRSIRRLVNNSIDVPCDSWIGAVLPRKVTLVLS